MGYERLEKSLIDLVKEGAGKTRISERDDPALLSAQFTESFYGDECRFGRNAGAPCRFPKAAEDISGKSGLHMQRTVLLCFIGKSIEYVHENNETE